MVEKHSANIYKNKNLVRMDKNPLVIADDASWHAQKTSKYKLDKNNNSDNNITSK